MYLHCRVQAEALLYYRRAPIERLLNLTRRGSQYSMDMHLSAFTNPSAVAVRILLERPVPDKL
ncbi:hypothetical protein BDN67DRAFT_975301 [Paxillus ammoniavirescens]|nr:hypothetical protein BDN67DRAFT_975301 [Paxillus ammoniavirescens]